MGRRAEPAPAGPRTVAAWWRIGVVLGITAVVLGVSGLLRAAAVEDFRRTGVVLLLGGATLLALGAAVFLQRVWSEPLHRDARWSALGRRLASAVLGIWSVGMLLNGLRLVGASFPDVLELAVGAAFCAAVPALLTVALLDRPGRR